MALFSGQHSWYDLSANPNDVPCEKCHSDIADEMIDSENGVHRDFTCAMCHRAPFNETTYARGHYYIGSTEYPTTPGEEAHAASTVECMDCHDGAGDKGTNHWSDREYVGECSVCHSGSYTAKDFSASGFGLTPWSEDTGEKAAHLKFVNDSMDDPLMGGSNEACIACHTRIGVNITWTKSTTLHFNASETNQGVWTIDDFTAHGSNITSSTYRNNWTNSY